MGERALRLALVGAGTIGREHAARIVREPAAALVAIADPAREAQTLATKLGAAWFPSVKAMLRADRPDAAIVATPNDRHLPDGLCLLDAGIATLVEKPLATDLPAAERLIEAAARTGAPLLVGHHRRHNPRLQAARRTIDEGRLGRIVAAHVTTWFHKPAAYFDPAWRREPGAGPIVINLIHDVDALRFLCGDVADVQALASREQRRLPVEDTAVAILRFQNGALATLTVSDTIAAPWSWEFTSGENPAYSPTTETFMMIGGTNASLALPALDLWSHPGAPDWHTPIEPARLDVADADPLALQLRNLCDVARGRAAALVPGSEGFESLRVTLAIHDAAATARPRRLA